MIRIERCMPRRMDMSPEFEKNGLGKSAHHRRDQDGGKARQHVSRGGAKGKPPRQELREPPLCRRRNRSPRLFSRLKDVVRATTLTPRRPNQPRSHPQHRRRRIEARTPRLSGGRSR
ncbi:MAG: hypothetical protein RML45_04585 [Acetobacteraceae bacterium]|nr:hypothetical protein [Acetobacteraceae bacterium]